MGFIMEAAQRAAALIRNAIGGASPARPAASAPVESQPAKPQVRSGADGGTERARRQLAESAVKEYRDLFTQLFADGQSVRNSVSGAAIDRAIAAGKGRNLSAHSFRMLVVGTGLGSCPNDGVTLTETGAAVLREVLGKSASTMH